MQSAGFRELDFQIDREIFGRSSAVVPRYSADRSASELVVRKVHELYPGWSQDVVEDQWGYIASWRCPGRPASTGLVLLSQHRASVITVAICRASLVAVRNMRSYELRRERRMGTAPPSPQAAPRRQRQRSG